MLTVIFLITILPTILTTCPESITNQQNLISQSNLQCFSQHYNPRKYDNQKLSKLIKERIVLNRKLTQNIKMNNIDYTKAEPVIKWAQNKQSVFVNFKLSHRHDSPPCSDVRLQDFILVNIIGEIQSQTPVQRQQTQQLELYQKYVRRRQEKQKAQRQKAQQQAKNKEMQKQNAIGSQQFKPQGQKNETQSQQQNVENFQNQTKQTIFPNSNLNQQSHYPGFSSELHYTGQCYLSRQKFLFHLNLTFAQILSKITIRKQSLGSYTIIGEKIKQQIWKKPFISSHKLSIWIQMREKYNADMDSYFQMIQNNQQQQPKRKKKRSNTKNATNNPNIDKYPTNNQL